MNSGPFLAPEVPGVNVLWNESSNVVELRTVSLGSKPLGCPRLPRKRENTSPYYTEVQSCRCHTRISPSVHSYPRPERTSDIIVPVLIASWK